MLKCCSPVNDNAKGVIVNSVDAKIVGAVVVVDEMVDFSPAKPTNGDLNLCQGERWL